MQQPKKSYRIVYDNGDETGSGAGSVKKDLMLVRLGFDDSEITVDLSADREAREASGYCCPDNDWCPACRKEIRREANAWLHELSETYPMHA